LAAQNWRIVLLLTLTVVSFLATLALNPIGQDIAYHNFADQRQILRIPNFANVVSNLPLLLVGVLGLMSCYRKRPFAARRSWTVVFLGIALVSFGSAFYHWHPNNDTLVWDRLPMTFGFMSLFIALTSEHVSPKIELWGLPLALIVGVGSLLWWVTYGDLRWYLWVQFFPLLVIAVIVALFPPPYTHRYFLAVGLGLYLLAKLAEHYDTTIFVLTREAISGHTLKHLLAAAALFAVLTMLRNRKLLSRTA
jgi:hypothetical protein